MIVDDLEPQPHGALPVDLPEIHAAAPQQPQAPEPHQTQTIDPHASIDAILAILQTTQQHHAAAGGGATGMGAVRGGIVTPTLIAVDDGGGGYYDDYSSDYGWWDSGGGIDWGGSNADFDGPAPSSTDAPVDVHLDQSFGKTDGSNGTVNVYFGGTTSDGKDGDQTVTQKLNDTTHDILAATPGLDFVNVSATTNGVHDTHSDHYTGNAVDINQVNGMRVDSTAGNQLALQLEAQALADPNTRYVEGPGGDWARSTAGGQWQQSRDLPTMNNHIHWSTFRH